MDTTIQISNELLQRLKAMKISHTESYESIIWDLIEDRLEFSKQTKENLVKSEKEIAEGKTISLEKLKKKVGA
jgi:predicted CopG family antitoxin